MRVYDTRLGKFLSVDPLTQKFAFYSSYHYAGNSPVQAIDLDGEEPDKSISAEKFIEPDPGSPTKTYSTGQVATMIGGYWTHVHTNYSDPSMYRYFYYEPDAKKEKGWKSFNPQTSDEIGIERGTAYASLSDAAPWMLIGGAVAPFVAAGAVEAAPALFSAEVSAGSVASGGGDFLAQMTFNKGDIKKINWTSVAASAFLKNPIGSAAIGSAFEVSIENGAENTIFGKKGSGTFLKETTLGSIGNVIGRKGGSMFGEMFDMGGGGFGKISGQTFGEYQGQFFSGAGMKASQETTEKPTK